MTLTLLLVGGIGIAIVAATVVSSRAYEAAPALAGDTARIGLADPSAETLVGAPVMRGPSRIEWNLTTVSALRDAESLLDCLENQGYKERELVVLGNSTFAVRWR